MKKNIILTALITALTTSFFNFAVFASYSASGFPDVDAEGEQFYTSAIYNMRDLGIMEGYEDGNFGPHNYVTRAELATILERYDKKLLNPDWKGASGIYPLQFLICRGGLEFNFELESYQDVYTNLCDKEVYDVR